MKYFVIQVRRVNSWFDKVTKQDELTYYQNVADEIKKHLEEQYTTANFEVKVKAK